MKPEKQKLIHDLLADENRQQSILLAGGQMLRRRRQRRIATQVATLLLAMAATVSLLVEQKSGRSKTQSALLVTAKPKAEAQTSGTRVLTDNELLSLFPNTPVGLATLPDGKKLLIFPRPEDAKQFYTRI
jgi:hypothetical protein